MLSKLVSKLRNLIENIKFEIKALTIPSEELSEEEMKRLEKAIEEVAEDLRRGNYIVIDREMSLEELLRLFGADK